jgi:phosphate transport system permease protein
MRTRRGSDRLYRFGTGLLAGAVPAVLAAILYFLIQDGRFALQFMGVRFFTTSSWNFGNTYGGAPVQIAPGIKVPAGASYGILPFVAGTLLTSAVALVVAVPVGILCALFLSEWAPEGLSRVLGPLVELLAGVPSVVYGLWGLAVVVPWVGNAFGPWLSGTFGFIPFLGGEVGAGLGLLTSGLVLAAMILPLVTATSRDAMRATPAALREGAFSLGLTDWEVARRIVLPFAWPAILGASILALGRAMGETMAVMMVGGGALSLPTNLYSPINTMAALIASQLDSSMADTSGMALHALAAVALVLFAITMLVNGLARLLTGEGAFRWQSGN